jgi:hypothetical protein
MTNHETKITFSQQMAGFPLAQMVVVTILKMAEPLAFTSLFPYAFFMIRDFGVAETQSEISTYAGYLAAVFAFGQVLSGVIWGNVSDKYGRKLVMIAGLIGSLMAILMLGFSSSYKMAFAARGMMGLLNGNSGVTRSAIAEIAPLQHHQSLAFLALPVAWNVGGVFGPYIGGRFSHPNKQKVPSEDSSLSTMGLSLFDKMNTKYPYALPNIIVASIVLCIALMTFLCLEETHADLKHLNDSGINLRNRLLASMGLSKQTASAASIHSIIEEGSLVSETTSLLSTDSKDLIQTSVVEEPTQPPSAVSGTPWKKILVPKVMNPIIAMFIMQAHFVAYDEFLPIFVSYPLGYDTDGDLISKFPFKLAGGLNYSAKKSGNLLSSSGFFGIVVIICIFPWVDRNIRKNTHFKVVLGMFPFLFLILPYVLLLIPKHVDSLDSVDTSKATVFLYIFVFVRVIVATSMGTLATILVNSNAIPGYSGVINGLSVSAASLASCVCPIAVGFLMSLGQDYNIAWLAWWVLAAWTAIGFIQSWFIEL